MGWQDSGIAPNVQGAGPGLRGLAVCLACHWRQSWLHSCKH